ncbi:uncharacterized protein N7473_012121 [Penicillium subrubescens]|nr:uncharacterized protein N7473_012121 [Penicillium subrubescens]KAJ5881068.1 hypothetical protein N7473_012121 [Penicillium subrubescens]
MAPTVAFVTGANRGLGIGLVKGFVAKPDYIVVAAVRDPAHLTAQELAKLPTGEGSRIFVVKYDASIEQSAFDAVKEAIDQGVDHLDYVVANAAIEVNVLSVMSLYQATRDLIQKSTIKPVYAFMGSGAGTLGRQPPVPSASYGASKSILPWYGTEMGNSAAKNWGIESAPITIEKSTDGMVRVITEGTKEQYGGKVVLYTGEVQEW